MSSGTHDIIFTLHRNGHSQSIPGAVPVEERIVLFINGQETVAMMCTPTLLEELALGFLHNEGIISSINEVFDVRICGSGRCVDVWLTKDIDLPTLRTITTGCSGGTTFDSMVDTHHALESKLEITPSQVQALMRDLHDAADLYAKSRGIHASALANTAGLVCVAEDVGRHNTIDKLTGICLRRNTDPQDHVLITTGRISSEMLNKAARMRVPIVISHTSPTSLAVELARAWNITLIGYARGQEFRCYAGRDRIATT